MLKTCLIGVLLVVIVAVSGFGFLFPMAAADHSHSHGTTCPYKPGEHALCAMNAVEHLVAWQKLFTSLTTSVLLAVLALAWVVQYGAARVKDASARARVQMRRAAELPEVPLYQHLFSQGILNPKAP